MTLEERLKELPDSELVYFGLSHVSGFEEIDLNDLLQEQLPSINTDYYTAEVNYAAEQKLFLEEAPGRLEKIRKEIDTLKKKLEKAENAYGSLKCEVADAEKHLAKANDIIAEWEPIATREVAETYARDVYGKGTVVIVPGELIGPPVHGYWTYEEAHRNSP
ncbi:MAG: hypothetical protein LUC48_09730 [Clostridiales bacterium]|nr:hypothetical protein [Clostridiales bacterium]